MNIVISDRALASLRDVQPAVRKAFHKQLAFLERNMQHPSLHAEKYDEGQGLGQARVNRGWRSETLVLIGSKAPHALKIPARRAESLLF